MKNILIYGLQRTGTNYLDKLLNKNFHIYLKNNKSTRKSPLHKHFLLFQNKSLISRSEYKNSIYFKYFSEFDGFITSIDNVDAYIVIIRNPVVWLKSYSNWAHKCGWLIDYENFLEIYYKYYSIWYDYSVETNKVLIIKYEELFNHTGDILRLLSDRFSFNKKFAIKIFGYKKHFYRVPHSKILIREKQKVEEEHELFFSNLVEQYIPNSLISKLGYSINTNHA